MVGVSGAGRHSNVNLQPTAGVETVDEPKQAEAATSVEIVDEASTATQTERARSMDMGNLNLADQLAAKLGELDEGGPSLIDEDALGIVDFANDMSGVVDSAKLEEMISWGGELKVGNLSGEVYDKLIGALKDMKEVQAAQSGPAPTEIEKDALGIVDYAKNISGIADSKKLEDQISWGAELLSIANLSPKVYKELKAAVKDMREIKTAQDRGGD